MEEFQLANLATLGSLASKNASLGLLAFEFDSFLIISSLLLRDHLITHTLIQGLDKIQTIILFIVWLKGLLSIKCNYNLEWIGLCYYVFTKTKDGTRVNQNLSQLIGHLNIIQFRKLFLNCAFYAESYESIRT